MLVHLASCVTVQVLQVLGRHEGVQVGVIAVKQSESVALCSEVCTKRCPSGPTC